MYSILKLFKVAIKDCLLKSFYPDFYYGCQLSPSQKYKSKDIQDVQKIQCSAHCKNWDNNFLE